MAPTVTEQNAHFTVFIRLPFPRGGFVDPPQMDWNSEKDNELWTLLSRPSHLQNINWKELADHFGVPLPFLFQQVAWLYDRQLSQVRAQIRKVGTSPTAEPSTGSVLLGDVPAQASQIKTATGGQREMGGGGGGSRAQIGKGKTPALRSPVSAQADTQTQSPRLPPQPKPSSHTNTPPPPLSATFLGQELSDAESESEESSSSDDDKPSPAPTQLKRFGKFSVSRSRPSPADLDEDEPPAFLPFSDRDSKSTIMQPATSKPKHQLPQPLQPQQPAQSSNASSTSASSGVAVSAATRSPPDHGSRSQSGGGGNGSSPRRTHGREQPLMSPHRRAVRREDSDTPSMGSSFSDLEDTSVTRSALEEALMSNIQTGGMASRMSTISQAFRSRYF